MAKKLNKKLVFVVGSLLIAVVVGGVGIFLIRYRYDAERHVRAGDSLLAAGDFAKAAEAYGRAVAKQRTNQQFLEKFLDATLKVRSETENDARERFMESIAARASLARNSRGDIERWRAYLSVLVEQAEASSAIASWKSISDACGEMVIACSQNQLGQSVAKIYSGYASLRSYDSLDDAARADAVAKLREAVAEPALSPADRDLAYGTLARIAVLDLARARASGVKARIDAEAKACEAALAEARGKSPDGLQTAIAFFERALIEARGNAADPALLERIDAVRAAAEAAKVEGITLLNVATTLSRGGGEGIKSAIQLLRGDLTRGAESLAVRRALAVMLRATDREAALKEIDAALALPRPTTSVLAAGFESSRLSCAIIRFDILHDAIESAPEAEREAASQRAFAAREDVARMLQGLPDDSPLLRVDAKLAMSRGDYQAALIKINEIFKKGSAVDFELYLLAASCSERIGEVGRALELLSNGLQMNPTNPALLKARAQLELRTGKAPAALSTIRQVRVIDPSDKEAERLEARLVGAIASDPGSREGLVAGSAAAAEFGKIQAAIDAREFPRARDLVAKLRTASKDVDPRVERLAVIVEMQAGDNAKALQIAKASLARYPGDAPLTRFVAVLSTEDPVERVVALTDAESVDPKERDVLIYLRLVQSEALVRESAERAKRLGTADAVSLAKSQARLTEGVAEWRKKAEAIDPTHPVLLESDFRNAVMKKDFTAAAEVVRIAKQGTRDLTQGPLLESQLLAEQGKLREAAEVLERSIQSGVDTSAIYRSLGTLIERQGNLEGALRQYEIAYERKPDDMQAVRLLVGATVRAGNLPRALEILRAARQLAGFDQEIASVWLDLEGQIGDRRLAMVLRDNQYRAAPGDIGNAVALATMLMLTTPDRADVTTEGGEPAYTEVAWQALPEATRNAAIDRMRTDWRKRAETILADATKRDPSNISVAETFANLLRALGRDAEGEKVLSDAVAAGGTDAGWRGYIALGNYQLTADKREAAQANFAEAIRREDKSRGAIRALADLLLSQERYPLVIPYLEDLAKTESDPTVMFRLSEAYMRTGQLDKARAIFDKAAAATPDRPIAEEMMDGALAMAMGDKARSEGKTKEAIAAYEAGLAPFQRAKALAPAAAQPFIQDSTLKRKLFEVTADRVRLQEALASADRAVGLSASFFPSCSARAEALLAGGDIAAALNEYDRFLRVLPTSVDARRRVVDLAIASGDLARAEASLRAAIGIAPGESGWFFALGDVLARRNRYPDAASAFNRADTLKPDPASFLRELDARIRARDFRGVTDAARRRGDFVRTNSTARAYTGIALIAAGEMSDGTKTLTESYRDAAAADKAGDDRMVSEWFTSLDLLYGPRELQQAEELLKKVMSDELTPRARLYLATLAIQSGTGGAEKAIAYLAPVENVDYSKSVFVGASVFDRLGTASYLTGNCVKAVEYFEKALKLTPDSDPVLNNFAYLCGVCLNDAKRGLPAARRAVQLNPGRVEYLDTLGSLLVTDSQFKEALELLDRAANIGNSGAVQYHRALALFGLNRKQEAREACEQALKLNPDAPMRKSIEELKQKLN